MNEHEAAQQPSAEQTQSAERAFTADEVRRLLGAILAAQEIAMLGAAYGPAMDEQEVTELFDAVRSGFDIANPLLKELRLSSYPDWDHPSTPIHRAVRAFEAQVREDLWNAEIEGSGGW